MANITSIGGNPIVLGTNGIQDGSITPAKLEDAIRKGYVRTYETVAQMQAATDLAVGMTCHTNGFHTSGDGGAAYYTISASGTANGMDVLALQDELLATLIPVNKCVAPQMFGAKGNGIDDDTSYIVAAFNYCKTNKTNLVAPYAQYIFDADAELNYGGGRHFDITFNGSIDNLKVVGNSITTNKVHIKLDYVTNLTIHAMIGAVCNINYVQNFVLSADDSISSDYRSAVYNSFYGGEYHNVTLIAKSTSWVNENHFYSMRIFSLTIQGNATHMCDNNIFENVVMENSPVSLSYARDNFVQYRGEGSATFTESNSQSNVFVNQYISQGILTPSSIFTQGIASINRSFSLMKKTNIFSYDESNAYFNTAISGSGTFGAYRVFHDVYIPLTQPMVFHFRSDRAMARYRVGVVDSDFNAVTGSDYVMFNMLNAPYDTGLNQWINNTNVDNGFITVMPLEAAYESTYYLHIEARTYNTGYAKYVSLDCFSFDSIAMYHPASFNPKLSMQSNVAPTTTDFPVGTFIVDSTGTNYGWRYTSSGWVTV